MPLEYPRIDLGVLKGKRFSRTNSIQEAETIMNEEVVIQILHKYFGSLFPKVCPSCKRDFATLREYIQATKRVGVPVSYDAEMGNWQTTTPVGSMALANCPCGTTLALSTSRMEPSLRLELLNWLRIETEKRGVSASKLLDHVRDEVRKRAMDADT